MLKAIKVDHSAIYFTGLAIMIISLPLSQFALSVGQFVLVGNWLMEGNFKNKYKAFISNKAAIVLVSLFLLHVAGLIHTTDFNYAFKDLRIKLPLLALPIIFVTTPALITKKFDLLLWLYIGAVLVATFIGFGILLFTDISNIREISPFISHIRLSLNICFAIFLMGYFVVRNYTGQLKMMVLLATGILWFIAYLIISESATGFFVLFGTLFFLSIWSLIRIQNAGLKRWVIILAFLFPVGITAYIYFTARAYLNPNKDELENLDQFSVRGNPYSHDPLNYTVENGKFIWLYVCDVELRESWNSRSNLDYDGLDESGQEIKTTLIRYLNSKGLRKDADAVEQLDDQDIRNIEQGIANRYYAGKFNLNARIYKFLWEYQAMKRGANPGGLSLVQRIEYWKAALGIIKENFWFGVGTGDMDQAFNLQYEKMKTRLPVEFRHRSHNQFLAIFTAFGVFGFIWFVFHPDLSALQT